MPVCPSCGKTFSGISIGSEVADVCKDCRKSRRAALEARVRAAGSPAQIALFDKPVVTYTILAINLAVYAAMGISGVSWGEPSTLDAIRWGADFGPLTLSHEWWRMVSSTFVHFGLFHVALNMICFWDLGRGLEPLMGRRAFLLSYAVSGLAASIVSLYWGPWRVSAGASGAIFGIAGAFVSYLYFRKAQINQDWLKKRLRSLAVFIGYNLLWGLRPGVDNSAHIGGLIAGLLLGLMIPPRFVIPQAAGAGALPAAGAMPSPLEAEAQMNEHRQRLVWIGVISVIALAAGFAQLRVSHEGTVAYGDAVLLAKSGRMAEAISRMEAAAELGSTMSLADDWLGEAKLGAGDGSGAVPHFQKTLEAYPEDFDTSFNLGLAYLSSGNPDAALTQVEKMGDIPKERASMDLIAGVAALRLNDLTTAKMFLPYAAQNNQKLWEAQAALAQLCVEEGKADEARGIYAKILKSEPDNAVAKANLEILNGEKKGSPAAKDLKPFDLPYAKLVLKSEAWPYYP